MTDDELAALAIKEREATLRTSSRWVMTGPTERDDGTAQIYAPNRGPTRVIVPIAETTPEEGAFIVALRNAAPELIRAAQLGKLAEAFLRKHGAIGQLEQLLTILDSPKKKGSP